MKAKKLLNKLRLSVGAQINALLIAVLIGFIMFAVYNYILLSRFNDRYEREIEQYSEIIELKKDIQLCDKRMVDFLKTGNRTSLAELNDMYEIITERLNRLHNIAEDEEAKYLLNSITVSFDAYYSECGNTAYLYNTNNADYFGSADEAAVILRYLENYSDELLEYNLNMSIKTLETVDQRQTMSIYVNLIITVLSVFGVLAVSLYIYRNMTRPINILYDQAVEIASGNFDVKPNNIKAANDIGVLAETFDQMCEGIRNKIQAENAKMDAEKKLILEQKKNIEVEKLLEETRFMALQSQTNPHFLFNTLNSINRTIMFGRNEQAMMMLDSLADLLRYNLTDANVPAELIQELKVTEKYLNIQKLRFSDRIKVGGQVDKALLNSVKLPKFSLQPLVENAIIHGIEPKTEGGTIIIDIRKRGGYCLIRIADNGMGMDRKRLMQIRDVNTSKRIGVRNTCQRIRYYTGREDSFSIYSKKGAGTIVAIRLPLINEEQ
ncbi:MAG: histidine kinase [Eubacteriales bacterium]|nr:histidine kinase [Eubacteriales bacterium]